MKMLVKIVSGISKIIKLQYLVFLTIQTCYQGNSLVIKNDSVERCIRMVRKTETCIFSITNKINLYQENRALY